MGPLKSLIFAGLSLLVWSGAAAQEASDEAPAASPTAEISPAAPSTAGTPLTAVDLNAWLDGYMPYALKTADIAGAMVVVVKDGQILAERGYGYSDVEAKKPVDPALTLFRPGSVSKLVTWTAVMQLVEQGKIDLDADVNQYLDFKIQPRDGKPVTMRNLMQHTAGFEEQAKGIMTDKPALSVSFEDLLKEWTPKRVFDAGTTPAYSNYGASLAGYIVERVSSESFYDYVDKHIFAPLDMTHSTFRQPLPADLAPLMSKGYAVASGKAHEFEFIGPAPAGSLASTGEDMAHFMIAHLQGGEYRGQRILRPETAELMHNSPLTVLPPLNRMELGFFETNINGREVIAHLGDTQDFHTSLHLFLADNVGLYVSFNSLGKKGAAGDLRGALFKDFADRYFPGEPPKDRIDEKTAAEHAKLLTGNWSVSRGSQSNFLSVVELIGQVHVSVGPKGELVVPFARSLNGAPRKWEEIEPFVWRDPNNHERLAAKMEDGKPVRFSIDELSPFMVYDRVSWWKNAAWLLPLLYASIAALALTVILWPVAAIIRWRYKSPMALEPKARNDYRLARVAALFILAALFGWAFGVSAMFSDYDNLTSSFDPVLWFLEIFGTIAFVGGALLLLRNVPAVWAGKRRWFAKLWSLVLAGSALSVLWVAFAFKLISFGVHY